ncbi:hypothetical protein BZA70DRAFT_282547 [Myxozyma melibiosi]|uniref:VPS10 domain-containing protein n=1 Tax=Myxozyma melibiosi TaxID=54550 RepID=A0ABR1F0T9_9ASCO
MNCAGHGANLIQVEINADAIDTVPVQFDGRILEYYYLERAPGTKGTDETVILRTSMGVVQISIDHGKTWKEVSSANQVIAIYPHPYVSDYVFLVTSTNQILVSTNRGQKWATYKTPNAPNTFSSVPFLSFHKSRPDWVIWHGQMDCTKLPAGTACGVSTHYSKNAGKSWTAMVEPALDCMFVTGIQQPTDENLVFCKRLLPAGGSNVQTYVQLISSTEFFKNEKNTQVHFNDIYGFAVQNDFVIVASVANDRASMRADVSVDGTTFAEAKFPPDFKVSVTQAYTILDTSTKAILMHVTVNQNPGAEYGTVLKSNSNGTDYVTSLDYVNRDVHGYVDYERMQGIEGILLMNTVSNPVEAAGGAQKKLRTKISFNDGATWSYLIPPTIDSQGNPTSCSGASELCSLNLHGYTEREDVRDTFSSGSAVGLMIGVGNVGPQLTTYGEGNTYLTRDAGLTWAEIKKGTFMWEYGDQGSIIVLVASPVPTNTLQYTFDEGSTWQELQFNDELVTVADISTVPSDTSRKFLIHAHPQASYGDKTLMIHVDFTGTTATKCKIDTKNAKNDDFELWTPAKTPGDTSCLFGHKTEYRRKIPNHFCYIGDVIPQPHSVSTNCTCERQDYECDANYRLANDGSCQLVPGYNPPNHAQQCAENPNLIEYFEPTGYRRIPLTTCAGGLNLDQITSKACPNHEKEFGKLHGGMGGFTIFLLVLLPFCMAGVIAYVLYNHYYGQYGQIRLGETDFDMHIGLGTENGLLKYPIVAVSAVVAFVSALPMIVQQLVNSRFGRGPSRPSRLYRSEISSRNSFPLGSRNGGVAGRYQYAPVDESEGQGLNGGSLHDDEMLASDDDSDDDFGHMIPPDAPHVNLPAPSSPQLSAAPSSPPADIMTPPSPASPDADLRPVSPEIPALDPPTSVDKSGDSQP